MRFGIVHLSDIHFKDPASMNPVLNRKRFLSESIHREMTRADLTQCLILISGDIAFSGKKAEYDIANTFLASITEQIKELNPKYKVYYFIVPGNHDCDFSQDSGVRKACISTLASVDTVDQSMADAGTSVQNNYNLFSTSWKTGEVVINSPLLTTSHVVIEDKNICIYGINSAWLSQQEEKIGKLQFPISYLPEPPSVDSFDVTICIMHHPYAWFETHNSKVLRHKLEALGDIILTGHEHESDVYVKSTRAGGTVVFFEGGVLQESKTPTHSSFNFLIVDCASKRVEAYSNETNSLSDNYSSEKMLETPFLRNMARLQNTFQISSKFVEFLAEPGAPYTHPNKDPLQLDDVFICPDLREFDVKNINEPGRNIPGSTIIDYILKAKHSLILGGDLAGRTTLAKHLFQRFFKNGLIPVYINGRDLNGRDDDSVYKRLCDGFLYEYQSPGLLAYEILPNSKRAIIIDDYHCIKFNGHTRAKIIDRLSNAAEVIVLLGLTQTCIEEILNHTRETSFLLRFEHPCEISELTPVQVEQMVTQWYQIGSNSELNPQQAYEVAVHPTARRINEVLHRDFMPAYPFVILTLLNQIETFTKLDTKQASLGFLYEGLVKIKLSSASTDLVDADTQYNYLSELAYCMFKKKSFRLTREEIEQWHRWYIKEMKDQISFEKIMKSLVDTQLIFVANEEYSFKYRMQYFFFAGRYFSNNLSENQEIRELVNKMTKRLYNEDTANIIMFTCYFSKESYVLRQILDSAKSLFSSSKPFEMDKDIQQIGEKIFQPRSRQLQLPAESELDGNRQEATAAEASADKVPSAAKSGSEINIDELDLENAEDSAIYNESLQTNAAFKTIQIIGQALRTYSGSIKGDLKVELTRQCFELGLRTMAFHLNLHAKGRSIFHESLVRFLDRQATRNKLHDDERESLAKKMFVNLVEFFVFILIRHVAESVGSQRLMPVYSEILEKSPTSAMRLIDFSIKLDHSSHFPLREMEILAGDLKRNHPFPFAILRRLVWQHLRLARTDYIIRQKSSVLLDLALPRLILMSTSSTAVAEISAKKKKARKNRKRRS